MYPYIFNVLQIKLFREVCFDMKLRKISLLLVLFCFFNITAAFAATDVTTDETTFTISVNIGEDYAGSEVSVVVIAPKKSVDNIAAGEWEAAKNIVPYIDQKTVGESGNTVFTYTPVGDLSGRFKIVCVCKEAGVKDEVFSSFATYGSVVSLINDLKANPSVNVAKLFTTPSDPEDLAGYEILGFADLKAYSLFSNSSFVTEEVKTEICKDLAGILDSLTSGAEKQELQTAFSESVFCNVMYMTDEAEKMRLYIDQYATDLKLDTAQQFATIYNDDILGESGKDDVASLMAQYDWNGENLNEISDVFAQNCFLTAILPEYSKSYSGIAELIDNEREYLISKGVDMDAYDDADSNEICRNLSAELTKGKIESFDDFIKAFNELLGNPENEDDSTGKTSGGRGGYSGGTGSVGALHGLTGTAVSKIEQSANEQNAMYSDIDSVEWAVESIAALSEMGVLSGKGDGKFYPNDNVTRAEFAKIIALAFNLYDEEAQCSFDDVSESAWYYGYVASAYKNNIINGYDGVYAPENNITREDAAVIIGRVLGVTEVSEAEKFIDDSNIADYAKTAVYFLRECGVINGVSETEFAPKAMMSRAQAAKIIYGALNLKGGE